MLRYLAAVLTLLWATLAHAQFTGPGHLDVLLATPDVDPGPGVTRKITTAFNGDVAFYLDNLGAPPIDGATGHKIWPGRFGEFPGVNEFVTGTDDPGFQAFAGAFGSREWVFYRAIGALERWDPVTGLWGRPVGGERIALYGGLPPELVMPCGTLSPPAACAQYLDGTQFHADGISGPVTAVVARSGTNGALHAHLDWFLIDGTQTPPPGAYLVTLQVFSTATENGVPRYLDSDPFHVLFDYNLSGDQFWTAFEARINPVPEPETAALFAAGALLLAARVRRRVMKRGG